jgi:UDP-hydrolysing UDP-N-acetyl-D-glucosamine 2-epimerase
MTRQIGIVTTARSEYGIYRQLLRKLAKKAELSFGLFVGGTHLSAKHGNTIEEIEAEGWPILSRMIVPEASETPEEMAIAMGRGTSAMASALARTRPDILVVLGDRFEMHAAALAALPYAIPIAHIHGGELSLGAIDDAFRHSLTKVSHLHFPSTPTYARRIIQMGEEPWRVTVAGAPALDAFLAEAPLPLEDVERRVGMRLNEAPILVTLHSETLGSEPHDNVAKLLAKVLSTASGPIIITAPNADIGGRAIERVFKEFATTRRDVCYVLSLGARAYRSVLERARFMIGNSSSGLIEAASFQLPVVNIGERQAGRLRPLNVIDVPPVEAELRAAISKAESLTFRASLAGIANPYGDGHASEIIADILATVPIDSRLLIKRFNDLLVVT